MSSIYEPLPPDHPQRRDASPVISLSDIVGETMRPDELRQIVSRWGWKPTFISLARMASVIANDGGVLGKHAREMTVGVLLANRATEIERRIHAGLTRYLQGSVGRSATPAIAHEAVIYMLQAMALLYGRDGDAAPTDGELSLVMLAANDHVFRWREPDRREVTALESLTAEMCRSLLFNHSRDALRAFVRYTLLFRSRPRRSPEWSTDEKWNALQRRAFDASLTDYIETFAGPLFLVSETWGRQMDHARRSPQLNLAQWIGLVDAEPVVAAKYFDHLTIDRESARSALRRDVGADGLPIGTTLFHHTPLVRIDEGNVVAASPWAVREHLRIGLWDRFRRAAQTKPKGQSDAWPSAFGDLFEQWCQHVAREAARQPTCIDRIIVPDNPGTDEEIEDVVIQSENAVVLVSVKGRIAPEALLKRSASRTGVIEWLEQFFYAEPTKSQRGGAARLLDAKVAKLRRGEYEPALKRSLVVFPMIVVFDDIGLDNAGVHNWLTGRRTELGILNGPDVRPLLPVSIDTFERLLGCVARGTTLASVLHEKTHGDWRTGKLDSFLSELAPQIPPFASIEKEFLRCSGAIRDRMARRLEAGTGTRQGGDG